MTHLDRLIDLSAQVTAGRTAATLDQLAATGALSPADRRALAADEALGSLERLLRTAELAGHDPAQVLTAAAEARSLDGATSPAKVLHHRITHALHGQLTPRIESTTDLIPTQVDPGRRRDWLQARADDAETLRHELGAQAAADPPRWALDALGPVPGPDDDVTARLEWERRAGWAAAWRELAGHTDENDPLGRAPARGLVEKSALFRKAHEELRLLDVGAEEADMSDGRLRARVRAMQLEEERAPADVSDELAAAYEQADKARVDATVWAARADAAAGPDREQFQAAAEQAARTAAETADRITGLEAGDEARGQWYLDSVVTRDYAHRSASELRARGVDPYDTSDHVTGDDWLDAHRAAQADDDQHREIHPDDIADEYDDTRTDVPERRPVREVDQTAEMVARAQETLRMIEERRAAEVEQAAHEASRVAEEEARAAQLTQWSQEDEQTVTDTVEVDDSQALER